MRTQVGKPLQRAETLKKMKKCPCGKSHDMDHPHFTTKKYLEEKGSQVTNKGYKTAHEKADKQEKAKYPKAYEDLKQQVRKIPKGQLLGKVEKGKIEVSKKVPKSERNEVAYHEASEKKSLKLK